MVGSRLYPSQYYLFVTKQILEWEFHWHISTKCPFRYSRQLSHLYSLHLSYESDFQVVFSRSPISDIVWAPQHLEISSWQPLSYSLQKWHNLQNKQSPKNHQRLSYFPFSYDRGRETDLFWHHSWYHTQWWTRQNWLKHCLFFYYYSRGEILSPNK